MHITTFQNKVLAFWKLTNAKMRPAIAKIRIPFIIGIGIKVEPACPGGAFRITHPKKDKHINARFMMLMLSDATPHVIPIAYITLSYDENEVKSLII